jgi:hypothetical protein
VRQPTEVSTGGVEIRDLTRPEAVVSYSHSRASNANTSWRRGRRTASASIDYDAELRLHNERLRAAYEISTSDYVLDIFCRPSACHRGTSGGLTW